MMDCATTKSKRRLNTSHLRSSLYANVGFFTATIDHPVSRLKASWISQRLGSAPGLKIGREEPAQTQ